SFRRCVELAPGWPSAHASLVEALLRHGDPAAALQAAVQAGQWVGYDSGILAFQYYALCELGDTEAARALLAFEQLTRCVLLPLPPGYADHVALNRALAAEIRDNPSLMWEPLGKTTRGGRQTTNLLERATPAVAAFAGSLAQVVANYLANLPADHDHPLSRHILSAYGFDMWATVLESGGHQEAHIHTSGVLSGVYYVQLPETVRTTQENHAGWLEF